MKEGLIGVIVPVYKVEKHIAECIESILAQIYTHFRLYSLMTARPIMLEEYAMSMQGRTY